MDLKLQKKILFTKYAKQYLNKTPIMGVNTSHELEFYSVYIKNFKFKTFE